MSCNRYIDSTWALKPFTIFYVLKRFELKIFSTSYHKQKNSNFKVQLCFLNFVSKHCFFNFLTKNFNLTLYNTLCQRRFLSWFRGAWATPEKKRKKRKFRLSTENILKNSKKEQANIKYLIQTRFQWIIWTSFFSFFFQVLPRLQETSLEPPLLCISLSLTLFRSNKYGKAVCYIIKYWLPSKPL